MKTFAPQSLIAKIQLRVGPQRRMRLLTSSVGVCAAGLMAMGGIVPAEAATSQVTTSVQRTFNRPTAALSPSIQASAHQPHQTAATTATYMGLKLTRSGVSSIRIKWAKVAKAKTYKVRVSYDSKLKKIAKTLKRSAKKSRNIVVKLPVAMRPGQKVPIYVRVTTTAKGKPHKTRVVKLTPTIKIGRGTVTKISQSSSSKLTVKYGAVANTTSYTIQVASNQGFTTFLTSYKRAASSSKTAVISLPKALRAGQGRATFVRVVARRYHTTATPSVARWLRMSVDAGTGSTLNVASYNVCNECMYAAHATADGTTVTDGDRDWQARRTAIAAAINHADPDVIGLQELTTSDYLDPNASVLSSSALKSTLIDRFVDLRAAINGTSTDGTSAGGKYQYAYADDDVTRKVTDPIHDGSRNAQLMYNSDTVSLIEGGILDPRSLTGGNTGAMQYVASSGNVYTSASYINNKWFSWGKFQKKSTGRQFYAVSVHLPELKDAATERVREQQTQLIVNFIEGKDSQKLPIVFVGDFNSRDEVSTSGAQAIMVNDGFTDAWNSKTVSNINFSTYTGFTTSSSGKKSLITTPKTYSVPAPRIDYIFGKYISGVRSYETQVVRTHSGMFDPTFVGSDHKLIRAQMSLG